MKLRADERVVGPRVRGEVRVLVSGAGRSEPGQIVEYLARQDRPMPVGEIVAAVALAQSTVSQHLKILAEVRFVVVEAVGTARHYRINRNCVTCFPSAADVVMGNPAPTPPAEVCR